MNSARGVLFKIWVDCLTIREWVGLGIFLWSSFMFLDYRDVFDFWVKINKGPFGI